MTHKLGASGGLIVRGEDQLFSFKGVLLTHEIGSCSGADGYFDHSSVPAGEIWIVTVVTGRNNSRVTTEFVFAGVHNATIAVFHVEPSDFAIDQRSIWNGEIYLGPGDNIRVYNSGSQLDDSIRIELFGHRMTLET